jgi:ribosomal protein S27AE
MMEAIEAIEVLQLLFLVIFFWAILSEWKIKYNSCPECGHINVKGTMKDTCQFEIGDEGIPMYNRYCGECGTATDFYYTDNEADKAWQDGKVI